MVQKTMDKPERQTLFHIPGWCGRITLASQTGATDAAGHVVPGAYYTCRPGWAGEGAPGVIDLEDLTEQEWHGIQANFKPVVKLMPAKDAAAAQAAIAAGKEVTVSEDGITFIRVVIKDEIDMVIEKLQSARRALNLKEGPPPPQPVKVENITEKEKAKLLVDRQAEQGAWVRTPGRQRTVQKVTHGAATAGK
jgi:hypothetical protein